MALFQVTPLGVFFTYFYIYNHAHCLHLEKLLYLELPKGPSGYLRPLLDTGGQVAVSEVKQPLRLRMITVLEVKWLKFYNGYM
jgi:hypothetical protein